MPTALTIVGDPGNPLYFTATSELHCAIYSLSKLEYFAIHFPFQELFDTFLQFKVFSLNFKLFAHPFNDFGVYLRDTLV